MADAVVIGAGPNGPVAANLPADPGGPARDGDADAGRSAGPPARGTARAAEVRRRGADRSDGRPAVRGRALPRRRRSAAAGGERAARRPLAGDAARRVLRLAALFARA